MIPHGVGKCHEVTKGTAPLVQQFFKNAGWVQGQRPWSPSAGSPSLGESAESISAGVRADGETPCAILLARGEWGEEKRQLFRKRLQIEPQAISLLAAYNPLRHAFGVPPPLTKGRLSEAFHRLNFIIFIDTLRHPRLYRKCRENAGAVSQTDGVYHGKRTPADASAAVR